MKCRRFSAVFPLVFLSTALLASCGQRVSDPEYKLRILTVAKTQNGTVTWDPNDDDVLWVSADGLPEDQLETIVWRQDGLPVDDSGWLGRDLNLVAGAGECGYGGLTFTITARSPDRNDIDSLTVRMERYICSGSPWTSE